MYSFSFHFLIRYIKSILIKLMMKSIDNFVKINANKNSKILTFINMFYWQTRVSEIDKYRFFIFNYMNNLVFFTIFNTKTQSYIFVYLIRASKITRLRKIEYYYYDQYWSSVIRLLHISIWLEDFTIPNATLNAVVTDDRCFRDWLSKTY